MTAISQRDYSDAPQTRRDWAPPQRLIMEMSGQEEQEQAVRAGHKTLSIEARQETADQEAQVGGDFFDCFPAGDGRTAIVVGDVCGSGARAAAHVPSVKFALRAFLGEHRSPAVALALLNNLLCAQQEQLPEQDRTVALTLALIDERTGEAECVTAGSEPPLVLRLTGGWDASSTTGILLGVEPQQSFHSATEHLNPGDMLIMATDGVTEAHVGPSFLGFYGMAYLAVTAYATAPMEPSAIAPHVAASILSGARTFAGGRFHDDVCLVAVRWGGL